MTASIVLDGTPEEVFTQVEPLRTMGLTVPDTVDLLDRLRKDGLDVPLDALTVEECADCHCGGLLAEEPFDGKAREGIGTDSAGKRPDPYLRRRNALPAQCRGAHEL